MMPLHASKNVSKLESQASMPILATSPPVQTKLPLVIGVTSHRNIPAREIETIRERAREFFEQGELNGRPPG
jgi:hypothetical protein